MMYTAEDLKKAQEELELWERRWDNYSGNNPNKYKANISSARVRMHTIQESLKGQGIIELSEKDKLEKVLDLKYPNAQSKEIVTYNNQKFQKRFYPIAKSRSGKTVQAWGKEWVKI